MTSGRPITVAETSLFVRQAEGLWAEEERLEFIDFIALNPEAGDVIPDTGGVRKIRWRRQGIGKRGGVRVVYFYYHDGAPLYLLMIYAKSVREDMTQAEKQTASALCTALKQHYRS